MNSHYILVIHPSAIDNQDHYTIIIPEKGYYNCSKVRDYLMDWVLKCIDMDSVSFYYTHEKTSLYASCQGWLRVCSKTGPWLFRNSRGWCGLWTEISLTKPAPPCPLIKTPPPHERASSTLHGWVDYKGGIISDSIFNLVPSSKKWTKSRTHIQLVKLRDSELVHSFEINPSLKHELIIIIIWSSLQLTIRPLHNANHIPEMPTL